MNTFLFLLKYFFGQYFVLQVVFRSSKKTFTWLHFEYFLPGHGMENRMEWNGNFGMEYGRYQNGME